MLRHPPCSSRRLLQTVDARIPGIPPADPPSGVSSDVVVILAALLCALICVVGLVAVARCARSRRNSSNANANHSTTSGSPAHSAAAFGGGHTHATPTTTTTGASGASVTTTASKGLKKKALKALPKLAYADAVAAAAAARGAVAGDAAEDEEGILPECAICLSEFGEREEVRVMPQCGHGFHVACVDTWLRSNSSCPSCRRPIVLDDPAPPKRCRKCEDIILEAAVAASTSSSSSSAAGGRRGRGGFLP